MTRYMCHYILIGFLPFLGCASFPDAQTKQINNRRIEFAKTSGNGPAVVFENGLGGRMEWWREVIPEICDKATCFAYNRPGYGNSALPDTIRDGSHIVEELRNTLQSEGVRPPYVLVGHSLGGLYMQLFARRYPDEVGALVLVDSTHPTQFEGEGALEKQQFWVRLVLGTLVRGVAKDELHYAMQTGKEVLELPTLTGKPVFVLSASKPMKVKNDLARFTNEKRVDIARLYPESEQIWVDSGHAIPIEQPQAVIAVIRSAISRSKQIAEINEIVRIED